MRAFCRGYMVASRPYLRNLSRETIYAVLPNGAVLSSGERDYSTAFSPAGTPWRKVADVPMGAEFIGNYEIPRRNLCVDGMEFNTKDGGEPNWIGNGLFPPFAIFDIDAQENLVPYYATRAQAELAMARIMEQGA